MRNFLEQTLCLFLICTSVFAIDSGTLDTNFSNDINTAGWDLIISNGTTGAVITTDMKVDSLGRVVVVGSYRKNGEIDYQPFVSRYLADGQLDVTFGDNGILIFPAVNVNIEAVRVDISTATDTIFVAFNILNNFNNLDVEVLYLNNNASVQGIRFIGFDLGTTADRKDDFLADIEVNPVPFSNPPAGEVIIVAEAERTDANDTDFGIAKLLYQEDAETLDFDLNFSSDGMSNCYFDQAGGVAIDKAMTVKTISDNNYVVGGSTFEGNGNFSDGWNSSFCEFNQAGVAIFKWSTFIPNSTDVDSREFLADFVIYSSHTTSEYMLVLTKEPETEFSNKFDFAIRRYDRIFDTINNVFTWEVDTTFGSGPRHVSRIGFVDGFLFPSSSDDDPKRILVEPKNEQILIAGTSNWTDTNSELFSRMALAKLNKDGSLNTSWGTNQSGKAYVTLDNSFPLIFKDTMSSVAFDKNSEKIYLSGVNNQLYGSISRVHNDLIFRSGF